MSQASDMIRGHHRELMNDLTLRVTDILEGRPGADPSGLAGFLKAELLPHALGEERYLYPALDALVIEHGKPTATMSIDHEYIEGYIDWINETAGELRTSDEDEKPRLRALLKQLCLQLEAVLQVHMAKEERAYMPLFEQYLPEEEQKRIVDAMHEVELEDLSDVDREPLYAHKLAS